MPIRYRAYETLDNETKELLLSSSSSSSSSKGGLRAGCDVTKNVKPEYIFNSKEKEMLKDMPRVVSHHHHHHHHDLWFMACGLW